MGDVTCNSAMCCRLQWKTSIGIGDRSVLSGFCDWVCVDDEMTSLFSTRLRGHSQVLIDEQIGQNHLTGPVSHIRCDACAGGGGVGEIEMTSHSYMKMK